MKKRIMSLLMSVIMVASVLTGCGSEAGSGVSKGDTMTVSEMFDALVEDNGGEVIIYTSRGQKISDKLNVYPILYTGETCAFGYTKEVIFGDILTKENMLSTDDFGDDYKKDFIFNLVTDENGNVLYEEVGEITATYGTKFDETNINRVEINGKNFIYITTSDSNYSNDTFQLIIPETESMVGKTIVMDAVGTEGVYVNLEED